METKKILLLGEGGVGKTVFRKRLMGENFTPNYIATLGVEACPIRTPTYCANIWDCAGQEKFGGLRDGYYIQGQGAIFAFDLTSLSTLQNLQRWISDFHRVCGNVPFVFVGMKSDMPNRITQQQVRDIIGDYPYVEISNKNGTNLDIPLTILGNIFSL